jgi:hypothetical protein
LEIFALLINITDGNPYLAQTVIEKTDKSCDVLPRRDHESETLRSNVNNYNRQQWGVAKYHARLRRERAQPQKVISGWSLIAVPRSPRLLRTLSTTLWVVPLSKTGISVKRKFIAKITPPYSTLHKFNHTISRTYEEEETDI